MTTQIIEKKISQYNGDESFAEQYNQLVRFETELSGYTDADEQYVASIYAVQITAEPNGYGDFIGVYNLDGDQLNLPNPGSWELVKGDAIKEVPVAVMRAFESWD